MSKKSPLQRSKKLMEDKGYTVAIVEKWNPWAKVRQDLYGFIDLLCVGKNTVGVQTTTLAHMKERIDKIESHDNFPVLKKAGWKIEVHGWRKLKDGWTAEIRSV